MTGEQAVAFLLFAVVAAVSPGPSNVMLTAAGANAGVLRGLPCLLGVTAGMGLMMFLVPFGLASLVLRSPPALFQWVNPKSWLVSLSAAGTFLSAQGGSALAQSAALGGLFALAALPSCFVWLAFGAAIQRLLTGERRRRAFNIAMGALLALSIALIVR
jgi:threonine/homoserine/homoserine lactone efflux protein